MGCQGGIRRLTGSEEFRDLHRVWFGWRRLVSLHLHLAESVGALSQAHDVFVPLVICVWNDAVWTIEIVALLSQLFVLIHIVITAYGIVEHFLVFVAWLFEEAAANVGVDLEVTLAGLLCLFADSQLPRSWDLRGEWIVVVFALVDSSLFWSLGFLSYWDACILHVGRSTVFNGRRVNFYTGAG